MSLKIGVNKMVETADQAEELLFQARLENKRAVVVHTESGRAIKITKPNNSLTQFFSDLSGRTQREQSQIKEFVSSLRHSDAKLSIRSAQVVTNAVVAGVIPPTTLKNLEGGLGKKPAQASQDSLNKENVEDDEADAVEDEVVQIEGVIVAPQHPEQEKVEKINPKIKESQRIDVLPLHDKNGRKLAERARAEERKAEQRDINNDAAETEEMLVELALKRKHEADKIFEARGELLEATALKNRTLSTNRQDS